MKHSFVCTVKNHGRVAVEGRQTLWVRSRSANAWTAAGLLGIWGPWRMLGINISICTTAFSGSYICRQTFNHAFKYGAVTVYGVSRNGTSMNNFVYGFLVWSSYISWPWRPNCIGIFRQSYSYLPYSTLKASKNGRINLCISKVL